MIFDITDRQIMQRYRDKGRSYKFIAEIFNCTKQNVHSTLKRVLKTSNELEIIQQKGLRRGKLTRTLAMNKSHGIGLEGENLFFNFCKKMNLQIEDHRHTERYDFLVQFNRVEIKTSNLSKYGTWCFGFKKNLGSFDILVCCGIKEKIKTWFIIPNSILTKQVSIAFKPFSKTKAYEFYSQFIDQWDLLSCG